MRRRWELPLADGRVYATLARLLVEVDGVESGAGPEGKRRDHVGVALRGGVGVALRGGAGAARCGGVGVALRGGVGAARCGGVGVALRGGVGVALRGGVGVALRGGVCAALRGGVCAALRGGVCAVIAVAGLSLLLIALGQLRERRCVLAALVAFGTPKRTLGWAVRAVWAPGERRCARARARAG